MSAVEGWMRRAAVIFARNKNCKKNDNGRAVRPAKARQIVRAMTGNASSLQNETELCALCPLSRVKAGVDVRVKKLCASPEMTARLREIGFCEDQIIRLVMNQANVICQICNARLAISAQLAQMIFVEPAAAAIRRAA
jgi:Fe2+ transport system protein FeoA